jgi:SAM-dependent methyltransferase
MGHCPFPRGYARGAACGLSARPTRKLAMPSRLDFYAKTVDRLLRNRAASILVVAGDRADRDVFHQLGFTNVLISNLDARLKGDEFAPYRFSFQDARRLTFADREFDYAVVHDGLHHCSSPHAALLEMYRVARLGVVAIEARDSLVMRLALRLGLTEAYGHAAVLYNACQFGGVNNTDIPNYVYRWSESEIEKTINAYAPHARHEFRYFYGSALPLMAQLGTGGLKRGVVGALFALYRAFAWVAPRQQNLFAFYIGKPVLPAALHPWLELSDGRIAFNRGWATRVYKG